MPCRRKVFQPEHFTIDPFKPTYKGLVTPQIIYDQNKEIRDIPMEELTKIFPTPVNYQETAGSFILAPSVRHYFRRKVQSGETGLVNTLETLFGKKITGGISGNAISLEYKDSLPAEGYELEVNPASIIIRASAPAGIFYGIQSLKTLIPPAAWAKATKIHSGTGCYRKR